MTILVVGAGFAGAVHARELADAGYRVLVIDKKDHVAGHCHDYTHECGVRVHRYGPHFFHTSNTKVVTWLSRFTDWLPYEHRVVALLPDGRHVPQPINIDTVNNIFGVDLANAEDLSAFLKSASEPRDPIVSAEDQLYALMGPRLTNLFFRPYMRKMYQLDLTEIPASVVRRISELSAASAIFTSEPNRKPFLETSSLLIAFV
jgi:UDP-galactopyranose mutase